MSTLSAGSPSICSTRTSAAPGIVSQHSRRRAPPTGSICVEVVAEDLDGDVAAHAGDQLVEAHLDRLRELVGVAGDGRQRLLDARDVRPPSSRAGSGHSGARLQDDERVRDVRRHRIGRHLGGAGAREDERDLREARHARARASSCIAVDLREADARDADACTTMSSSLSVGTNSCPRRAEQHQAQREGRHARRRRPARGRRSAQRRASARRARFAPRTSDVLALATRPRMNSATIAGTKVSERTNAATSAKITVSAIGWNILPSTPVRERIGR